MDTHTGHGGHRPHHRLINGKGTDTGGNIAAVAVVVHNPLFDADLGKCVVHVRLGPGGRADDCQLAGQRIGAGQTIDLAYVRAAENLQNQIIPLLGVVRQVIRLQIDALAGAAPHNDAGNSSLIKHTVSSSQFSGCLAALLFFQQLADLFHALFRRAVRAEEGVHAHKADTLVPYLFLEILVLLFLLRDTAAGPDHGLIPQSQLFQAVLHTGE